MTRRRRSFRVAIAILSVIAPVLVVQAAFPGAAHARCKGEGDRVTSRLIDPSGETAVYEQPIGGTCNSNTYYSFRFRSNYDGWRASVWMEISGEWQYRMGEVGQSWHSATFNDTNAVASMYYCLDDTLGFYFCGYGENVGFFFGGTEGAPMFVNWGY